MVGRFAETPVRGADLGEGGADTGWLALLGEIAPVVVVIAFLVGCARLYIQVRHKDEDRILADLENPDGRDHWLGKLGAKPWRRRYRDRIGKLNAEFDGFFTAWWTFKAFDRCLAIALLYPIALYSLAWLFSGSGELAGVAVLPKIDGFLDRLWRFLLLALLAGGLGFYIRRIDSIQAWLRRLLWAVMSKDEATAPPITRKVIGGVADAVAVAGAVAVGSPVAVVVVVGGSLAGVGAVAGVGAGAVIVVGAVVVAVGGAGAVVITLAVGGAVAGVVGGAFIWLVFLVGLPLLNAMADWLSWAATRWLLRRAARTRDGLKGSAILFLELAFDLALACASLVLLAILLPNAIELANRGVGMVDVAPIVWQDLIETARAHPYSEGLMVTGMLGTTLFPTVFHLAFGLYAIFAALTPRNGPARDLLEENRALLAHEQKVFLAAVRRTRRWWWLPAVSMPIALLFALGLAVNTWVVSLGAFLANVAYCATSWSHGVCAYF